MTPFTLYYPDAKTRENQFENSFPNPVQITSADDLSRVIGWQHTGGKYSDDEQAKAHKITDCWRCSNVVIMDYDNSNLSPEEWSCPEDVKIRFPGVEHYITFSRHHNEVKHPGEPTEEGPRPRFHAVFPIHEQTDPETYKKLLKKTLACDKYMDEAMGDLARGVFGTGQKEVIAVEGTRLLDDYLTIFADPDDLPTTPAPEPAETGPAFSGTGRLTVPSSAAWDGISPIESGSRNSTIQAHMGIFMNLNANEARQLTDDDLRAELQRCFDACDPPLSAKERDRQVKQTLKYWHKRLADPAYIPDFQTFVLKEKQKEIEALAIIKEWPEISKGALAVIQKLDQNCTKHTDLIKRFNRCERLSKNWEKHLHRDLKTIFFYTKFLNTQDMDERTAVTREIVKHSALYAYAGARLTEQLPGTDYTRLDDAIQNAVNAQLEADKEAARELPTYKDPDSHVFLHEKAGIDFVEKYHCRHDPETHILYVYDPVAGRYITDRINIESLMVNDFISNSKSAQRAEIYKTAQLKAPHTEGAADARYIGFKNGVLDIETMQLLPNSPDLILLNIIPHNYVAEPVPVPVVDESVYKWACGRDDIIRAIFEMIGCCMYRGGELKAVYFLRGKTDNGKSVILDWLHEILGHQNTSAVPAQLLEERFQSAAFFGKLANISPENEPGYIRKTTVLKNMADGGYVDFERKGIDSFSAKNTATGVFSYNNLPRYYDPTGAVKNRIHAIPFDALFTEEKEPEPENFIFHKDPKIWRKLSHESAIEYAIAKAIQALRAALDRGKLTKPADGEKILEEIDFENNHVKAFLQDMQEDFEYSEEYQPGQQYVFKCHMDRIAYDYENFCRDNCISGKLGKKKLLKKISDELGLAPDDRRRVRINGGRYLYFTPPKK